MIIVKFPYDSNVRYLPLMYFLPEDVISRYTTLRAIPRDLSALSDSPAKIESINSNAFSKEIAEAMAGLAFPHFGFSANTTPGIPPHGNQPTPCHYGRGDWRKKRAGACKRFSVYRHTHSSNIRIMSSSRRSCGGW